MPVLPRQGFAAVHPAGGSTRHVDLKRKSSNGEGIEGQRRKAIAAPSFVSPLRCLRYLLFKLPFFFCRMATKHCDEFSTAGHRLPSASPAPSASAVWLVDAAIRFLAELAGPSRPRLMPISWCETTLGRDVESVQIAVDSPRPTRHSSSGSPLIAVPIPRRIESALSLRR
jgi:hypothetical protein